MFKLLLQNQIKEQRRNQLWQNSLAIKIVLGLLGLYLTLNLLVLSYFSDKIIIEVFGETNVIQKFTGLLFYYFSIDLIVRFLFQKFSNISIQPYLTMPIKFGTIVNYAITKSLYSFFNLMGLIIVLPFYFKLVVPEYGFLLSLGWVLTFVLLIATNSLLSYWMKISFMKQFRFIALVLLLLTALVVFEFKEALNISDVFSMLVLSVVEIPILTIIPPILVFGAYRLLFSTMLKNRYNEKSTVDNLSAKTQFSYLSSFGIIGNLINLEIKQIFRNKRPKTYFNMGIVFLLYGFLFYNDTYIDNSFFLIFTGIIMTSLIAMNYGQLLFSWESTFFDGIITRNIKTKDYVKAKYILLALVSFVAYFITLLYGIIDIKIIYINTSLFLYGVGVNLWIMMYLMTWNKKRLDLRKSGFMNYEGVSALQFLLMLPLIGVPYSIYVLFDVFGNGNLGYACLAIMGLLGVLFHNQLLGIIVNRIQQRKYVMATGFRKAN